MNFVLTSAEPNEQLLTDSTANPPNRLSEALEHQTDGCQSADIRLNMQKSKGDDGLQRRDNAITDQT